MDESPREVVVFEREPYWAPELRRQFCDERVRVRHCVDRASVAAAATGAGSAVLLIALEGLERECTELMRHRHGLRTLVVGSREHAELELPLREAGVVSFVAQQISGEQLATRIRRIWAALA